MAQQKQVNAWFGGDRTLEQQLTGLDWLWANCKGRTVLDAGCAEGLIGLKCAVVHGASQVHGVELLEDRVKAARKSALGTTNATFQIADMNDYKPAGQYDIVLGLAILHKLKDPSRAAARLAMAARETVIFRLPPAGAPTIVDRRSGNVPHDIGSVMSACGFQLDEATNEGPFGEWIGRWSRR